MLIRLTTIFLALQAASAHASTVTCLNEPWAAGPIIERIVHLRRNELPRSTFSEISRESAELAVARLQEKPYVRLRRNEVMQYVSTPPAPGPRDAPYLVRAIRDPNQTGGFFLYSYRRELEVRFASLGPATGEVFKTGVLVYLPAAPTKVYVACSGGM